MHPTRAIERPEVTRLDTPFFNHLPLPAVTSSGRGLGVGDLLPLKEALKKGSGAPLVLRAVDCRSLVITLFHCLLR